MTAASDQKLADIKRRLGMGAAGGGPNETHTPQGEDQVTRILDDVAGSLRTLASTGRSDTDLRAGTLEARILAVRARTIGARTDVTPEAVIAALGQGTLGTAVISGVPTVTGDLPTGQQVLVERVNNAVGRIRPIVAALKIPPDSESDTDEVEAVRAAVLYSLDLLQTEAGTQDPRRSLVNTQLLILVGTGQGSSELGRLRDLMEPDDEFRSREDETQRAALTLMTAYANQLKPAFDEYFNQRETDLSAETDEVRAEMRVVYGTSKSLRDRLRIAGLSDAEAKAPSARLSKLNGLVTGVNQLPADSISRFLDWVESATGEVAATQITTAGVVGLAALADTADAIVLVLDGVAKVVAGPLLPNKTAPDLLTKLRDAQATEELDALRNQMGIVAETARAAAGGGGS